MAGKGEPDCINHILIYWTNLNKFKIINLKLCKVFFQTTMELYLK